VERAIGAANGEPLVLNLSLGWAPPALLVGPLLQEADKIYDNLARLQNWLDARLPVGTVSRRSRARIANELRIPEDDGLFDRAGGRFLGALALVESIFPARSKRVLAVAAAGHDSCGDRLHGPRLPAAVNGALGVSAGTPAPRDGRDDLERSSFSNDDDYFNERSRFDVIGAFGGERASRRDSSVPDQALVGLFVSPQIPAEAGDLPNTCGLAIWEGTSFSTPVVAGFAAALWSEQPTLDAQQVRRKIVSLTDATGAAMEYLPFLRI
jgi:hypothetical protein